MKLLATRLSALIGAASVALTLSACGSSGPAKNTASSGPAKNATSSSLAKNATSELTPIHVTSQPNETGFPLWLADKLGYFNQNGLSVTIDYAASGAAALAAGAAGDWQGGWTGAPPALTGIATWGLVAVGGELDESSNNILWADTQKMGSKSVADFLKTAKIGAPPNSMGSFTVYGCAQKYNIDSSKFHFVNLDPPAAIQGIQSGRLDAIASFSSVDWPLKQDPNKYKIICDLSQAGITVLTPYIVTPKFAAASPDAAAGYLNAVYMANEYILANHAKAVEYLQQYYPTIGMQGSADKAEYALSKRHWLTLDQAIQADENGDFTNSLKTIATYFVGNGVLKSMPDIQKSVSQGLTLLKAAKAKRGQS